MTDELFPHSTVAVESPRLRWMKKHNVSIIHNHDVSPGDEDEFSGETIFPFCATNSPDKWLQSRAGYGNTEVEALADWARRNGVRLWNEPQTI